MECGESFEKKNECSGKSFEALQKKSFCVLYGAYPSCCMAAASCIPLHVPRGVSTPFLYMQSLGMLSVIHVHPHLVGPHPLYHLSLPLLIASTEDGEGVGPRVRGLVNSLSLSCER